MTPLEAELRRMIAADGPIPVELYMRLCLAHPEHGYYMRRDPFGARGDFTTAPEISQMFGELIGAWAAAVWQQMGAPRTLQLIELGPGRGTLMADALRATRSLAAFRSALSVRLVEVSPMLRQQQEQRLADAGVPVSWHAHMEDLPAGPCVAIANEFVDALAISQLVKDRDGWHARMVGVKDGRLAFAVAPDPLPGPPVAGAAPLGALIEGRQDGPVATLARRIASQGGAALVLDYGHAQSGFGDTLQAVRNHKFADPLVDPGEADLTAQVDFAALARTAERGGARVHGPVTQGAFLHRLGIAQRAARLKQNATPQQAADIEAALARLTAPEQMGELFKALAITHPDLGAPPGFDS
ncbi:MAG TPA: SAM-dependent methyltransferase [Xanthobacteraceae bacterium]|nr:SAM-dependent methyltransferase [Xanthobacteraceae bacterium]